MINVIFDGCFLPFESVGKFAKWIFDLRLSQLVLITEIQTDMPRHYSKIKCIEYALRDLLKNSQIYYFNPHVWLKKK